MARRTTAQRDQDRADLLAVLTDAGGPVRTSHLLATVNGVQLVPFGSAAHSQGLRDLHALERAGLVAPHRISSHYETRWLLATDTLVDEDEDLADVRRQRAQWVSA